MPHLSPETLARLVDEPPDPTEALHLEACGACRAELGGLREQTRALSALPDPALPAAAWPALERRLRAEGLGGARPAWLRPLATAAAALALFLSGAAAGAALRGGGAEPAGAAGAPPGAVAQRPEDAAARVRATEAAYLEALTRYAELTGAPEAVDPVNRLAALEGIVLTTRAALEEAPADPLINGYHLNALSQRDAMLRQISASSGEEEWF